MEEPRTLNIGRRLSAHDTVFLHWERPWQPMHVGEALVYDGEVTANEMVQALEARMSLLPRYRQKIVGVPLGLAHPTWQDDPAFDVRNHVDERHLPVGSDDKALGELLGELFSQTIDRSRPPWHVTVIHGHGTGTVAFLKLHHSMVDGVSSIDVITALHSPPPEGISRDGQEVLPRSQGSLLREAVADELDKALDATKGVVGLLRDGGVSGVRSRLTVVDRTLRDLGPMLWTKPPKTPFNAPISPARNIAWLELSLAEVHDVRRQLGSTVNDLLLTILSGATGKQMRRQGFATDGEPLRCMVPWSVRTQSQSGGLGNAVSMVVAPLYVDEQDPRERLQAQKTAMQALKDSQQAAGIHELIVAGEWIPAPLYALMWKLWPRAYFPFNIVSSNVIGPSTPLYLDKHELLAWYPVGVNWTTNGLFLVSISYRGKLTLGISVDPTIVSDLETVVADFEAAWSELKSAVEEEQ